ncbi:hypothetical protein HOLleu_21727 [Holothuria leucospilota]|uniref:Uncharacterized protein n=1 Tax=Holothuria leucospilota TaxID=206669 RepID=A0A9Q1H706_HOLLE|nr:hypothetical protein HOLleu_21727 [Holothuria leucospilota]
MKLTMNNNYRMNRDESYMGRQGSPWKSVSAGPVKKNHSVKFRPHVDFIPGARDELYPELRGSYYSRIPPLSPHQYGCSADKLPLLRNDASRPLNHEQNDIASKIPGASILYPSKTGLKLDNDDRSSYNLKGHYFNDPDNQTQGHFFQDARNQSEIPLHNSRSTLPPHRHRTLPYNDEKGYVEGLEGISAYPNRPPDNRHKALYDRRHSHEAVPVTGRRLQGSFTPKPGVDRDSPWGDRELWELDNTKRYNSLPALNEHKRLAPTLLLPYNSYRGEFPLNKKQVEQQRAFWDNRLDPTYLRYLADPQNAESFIERFVESCIQESLVLEVAAEVLVESRELQELLDRTSKPVILAAKDVLNDFLDEELLKIVKEERLMSVSQ